MVSRPHVRQELGSAFSTVMVFGDFRSDIDEKSVRLLMSHIIVALTAVAKSVVR